jgi:SET domain-containing protein
MKRKNKTPHDNAYTRLGISKIQGIGVFAIRDIPNNKKIFAGETSKLIWFSKKKVDQLEPALRRLYEDFCILEGDKYGAPDNFNNISIGWFLNHSAKTPNVRCNRNCDYVSTRKIKAGEELSVDYSSFAETHPILTKLPAKSKNK